MIIGAAGGVGSIATQLGRLAGLTVIGTASRPESIQWAKEHGAASTISHREAFAPQLTHLGFERVDYIFCLNSTEKHWRNMTEVIAPQGKSARSLKWKSLSTSQRCSRKASPLSGNGCLPGLSSRKIRKMGQANSPNTAVGRGREDYTRPPERG